MVFDRRTMREHSVLAGLEGFCHDQGLTSSLASEVIEAFLCRGLEGRAPSTKGTYYSVLRHLAKIAEPKGAPHFAGSLAPAPYSVPERVALYSIATSQRRAWRRYSATTLLALGLGAGLRSGEIVAAQARDVVVTGLGVALRVRGARARVVTLRGHEATLLSELVGEPHAYLFHPEAAKRSYPNFVNDFARQLLAGPDAVRFSAQRARSSYICEHLARGTALSVLLCAAGITEVESLLRYARHGSGPKSKAALRAALASEHP